MPAPQVVEQAWVVVLHAWPAGQSVGALQPHAPVARHACPPVLFAQLVHSVPLPPQAPTVVPG